MLPTSLCKSLQTLPMYFDVTRYTQRTTVNIPPNYMLIIPEDLSYQLGMEGRVYMGPRMKAARTTDVNYRNHKRAPLLRQMAVHPNSSVNMRTVDFPYLIYHPMKHTYFRQVSVYLRDSAAQPIPFEYGEVSVVLSLRPSLAVRGPLVVMVNDSYLCARPYVPKRGKYPNLAELNYRLTEAYGGVRRHCRHSIFGSLVKAALPMLKHLGKSACSTVGSKVSSVGTGLLTDLLSGKNLKNSLLDRTKSAARSAAAEIVDTASSYLNRREASPPTKQQRTSLSGTPTDKNKNKNKNK